eukprot:GHVN01012536.1.p1 GENE.GHVN01012536.1~~GHVN01012536.1.p1  ORF type:complete len:1047 (+),score=205.04 GHVN01012536.1:108-3248(+)
MNVSIGAGTLRPTAICLLVLITQVTAQLHPIELNQVEAHQETYFDFPHLVKDEQPNGGWFAVDLSEVSHLNEVNELNEVNKLSEFHELTAAHASEVNGSDLADFAGVDFTSWDSFFHSFTVIEWCIMIIIPVLLLFICHFGVVGAITWVVILILIVGAVVLGNYLANGGHKSIHHKLGINKSSVIDNQYQINADVSHISPGLESAEDSPRDMGHRLRGSQNWSLRLPLSSYLPQWSDKAVSPVEPSEDGVMPFKQPREGEAESGHYGSSEERGDSSEIMNENYDHSKDTEVKNNELKDDAHETDKKNKKLKEKDDSVGSIKQDHHSIDSDKQRRDNKYSNHLGYHNKSSSLTSPHSAKPISDTEDGCPVITPFDTQVMVWVWGFILLYMFYGMAISCDEYFVPSLQIMSDRLSIPDEVAGATLMAMGSGAPEMCTNFISIFITNSAVGVGTVVGSELFNMTVIVGVCAIVASRNSSFGHLHIDMRTFTRDVLFFAIAITVLGATLRDGQVTVAEGSVLVCLYLIYALSCVYTVRISKWLAPYSEAKVAVAGIELDEDVLADEESVGKAGDEPLSAPDDTIAPCDGKIDLTHSHQDDHCTDDKHKIFLRSATVAQGFGIDERFRAQRGNRHDGYLLMKDRTLGIENFVAKRWERVWLHLDNYRHELIFSTNHYHATHNKQHIRGDNITGESAPIAGGGVDHQIRRCWSNVGIAADAYHLHTDQERDHAREVLGLTPPHLTPSPGSTPDSGLSTPMDPSDHHYSGRGPAKLGRIMLGANSKVEALSPTDFCITDTHGKKRTFRAADARVKSHWLRSLGAELQVVQTLPTDKLQALDRAATMIEMDEVEEHSPFHIPPGIGAKVQWVLELPLKLIMWASMPSVYTARGERLYVLTFVMSMMWLAAFSFVMCIAADATACILGVPKSLVGLTIAAAGTSFPNVFASYIVAKQGLGSMGVANAFGSNNFNIFVALGFPWLMAAIASPTGVYTLHDASISSTIMVLAASLVTFVLVMAFVRLRVGRILGYSLLAVYGGYILCVVAKNYIDIG